MLAEMFMVRLEAEARLSSEAAGHSRFVPFVGSSQFGFKHSRDRAVEPIPETASCSVQNK